ncbi:tetratricopeptide repeat protein [Massilia solisilvae]|uniref:Tetratricopeptide repeat protein n=1 Tax=Massilia solisilvae TaxID=1811225 RepID=A0ABT2BI52_9BURK|nr:tetratricopeptide repeat protein [Massilia solisilvae]MCS0608137.1 tetratricopeptide repeat protein [Massilia solisilvae]
MQGHSNLSVLVVDPNPGMRSSLQNMLNQAGISKVEYAVNSGTAIKQLMKKSYDIILCEYDLGVADGQDGQQLLEDLRHHKLIGLLTIFIMLTSEAVYSKVVSAAELTPTDYILKPFTVETLVQRIGRAVERRMAFLPTFQLIGQGNLREAIRSCIKAEAEHPRYATDFARLRAEMLVSLKQYDEAEKVYREILDTRPLGWAHLGHARAVFALGRVDEARAALEELIKANPQLMSAYDLLARCHEAEGQHARAKEVLENAVAISPHMVRRLRKLGEVALDAGDVAAAEKSFKQVVSKARYSEFRNPEDHVNLVKALVKKGDSQQAGGVVRDLERSLRGSPGLDACKAYATAMLHEAAGNPTAAAAELKAASNALKAASGLSSGMKMALVRSCLDHKLDAEASDVMLSVVNDVNSEVTTDQAVAVFERAGRHDLARGIGEQLSAQAQVLLGVADEKRNMGDVRGAVQSLLEAYHIAPDNLKVILALTGGILRQMNELGWDHPLGELCHEQIEKIRKLDPQHPRLQPITDEYNATRRKYGIAV